MKSKFNFPENTIALYINEIDQNKKSITIKDNYAISNQFTTASSLILQNFKPLYNATIVNLINNANYNIVAKTHLDEFGLGGSGLLSAFGKIFNPLNPKLLVGGSSSGSAASFTDDIFCAIGSDTGNSVRLPSSYIGKVGFKPTYGAISRYGLFAYSSSLDTVAFFTHNVQDSIEISNILFYKDPNDMTSKIIEKPINICKKPKKIAYFNCLDSYPKMVKSKFINLMNSLKQENIVINPIEVDTKLLEQIVTTYEIISFTEATSNLSNLSGFYFGKSNQKNHWKELMISNRTDFLGSMVQERLAIGSYILQDKELKLWKKAWQVRAKFQDIVNKIYKENDILIMPATDTTAPKVQEIINNNWTHNYSTLSNLVQTPSISIPWIKDTNNLPINILIDSQKSNDKDLLSFSLWIENFLRGVE